MGFGSSGIMLLTFLWACDISSIVLNLISILLLVCSSGSFLTRLFLNTKDVEQQVLSKIEADEEQGKAEEIKKLERDLTKIPGTKDLLSDLLKVGKALRATPNGLAAYGIETSETIDKLLDESFVILKNVVSVSSLSAEIPRLADKLRGQRETLIDKVKRNVECLGNVLIESQSLSFGQQTAHDLAAELDSSVSIAQSVKEEMDFLVNPTRTEKKHVRAH